MPTEHSHQHPGNSAEPTIVAVATPPGIGGLAAVRLSGPTAFEVASRVLREVESRADFEERQAVYSILETVPGTQDNEIKDIIEIDQVVVLPYREPRSFTGEDVVEIFCHGGNIVAQQVVQACLAAGAEPAPAGEFTRRAFLNGKLSLDQAEAVADLIHAETRLSARAAVRQLLGGLDRQLGQIEEPLLRLLAELEGSLEFSEEEADEPDPELILGSLEIARTAIEKLQKIGRAGRLLRDGIQVVLVGAPNAGKSSLLNALVEEDRAIVDAEPGTTRDVVSARHRREGTVYVFHDTAGLRTAAGSVEQKGIERTGRMLQQADIALHLVETTDLSSGFPSVPDPAAIPGADVRKNNATHWIRVATKSDLLAELPAPEGGLLTSSVTGQGIDELWSLLESAVADFQLQEATELGVLLNQRHLRKLAMCRREIERLQEMLRTESAGAEVIATLLASITAQLGEVSGRVFSEQVLGEVFGRFCVGK